MAVILRALVRHGFVIGSLVAGLHRLVVGVCNRGVQTHSQAVRSRFLAPDDVVWRSSMAEKVECKADGVRSRVSSGTFVFLKAGLGQKGKVCRRAAL